MREKLRLKRSLSFRHDVDKDIITIGVYPPKAVEIDHPPSYLPRLLAAWSEAHTIDEIRLVANDANPTELDGVIQDLLALGVVEPEYAIDRFDRHQLYFDFFDVPRDDYVGILSKKR